MLKFIIDRLKERSTWLGLTGIVAAAGIGLHPEQTEAIIALGIAAAGAVAAFTKDHA